MYKGDDKKQVPLIIYNTFSLHKIWHKKLPNLLNYKDALSLALTKSTPVSSGVPKKSVRLLQRLLEQIQFAG